MHFAITASSLAAIFTDQSFIRWRQSIDRPYGIISHYAEVNNSTYKCKINLCGVERNRHYIFWVCVRSLIHPIYKAGALYYIIIYGVSGLPNLSTLSSKRYDFQKHLRNIKCVVWFSLQIVSEIFLILRILQRDRS